MMAVVGVESGELRVNAGFGRHKQKEQTFISCPTVDRRSRSMILKFSRKLSISESIATERLGVRVEKDRLFPSHRKTGRWPPGRDLDTT